MKYPFRIAIVLISGLAGLVGAQEPVRVLTHSSFDLPLEVIEAFTEETGFPVELLPAGDAGELVNRAILTAGRPVGDVLFGVDNSLLARAAGAGVFEPYEPESAARIPASLRFDEQGHVTPVTVGYVAFNVDRAWFADGTLPADLTDLTKEEFRGLTVVQDPAASSTGLAFMLATIDRFGEDGWLQWWADLRDNDLQVTSGWTDAYYTAFSAYGGDRPIVLSYASSPAAEVIFAAEPLDTAPTYNLLCDRCTYRQIEAAGVLEGSSNVAGARAFIDFLLSAKVQESVPMAMFVYPVMPGTSLPDEFEEFAAVPQEDQVAHVDDDLVSEHQQRWLQEWTQVVMQGRDPTHMN